MKTHNPPDYKAVKPAPVLRNCTFAYQCTRTWADLKETIEEHIRYCDQCHREVHLCESSSALSNAIALNRCVAIRVEDHLERMHLIGMPKQQVMD